jgi:hypothetical protein
MVLRSLLVPELAVSAPISFHLFAAQGSNALIPSSKPVIRTPHYELCLQAKNASIGARLRLAECIEAELRTWTLQDSGEIALEALRQMCIMVEERPGRNTGGPQYLVKGAGLDTCAQQASDRQRWETVIPR